MRKKIRVLQPIICPLFSLYYNIHHLVVEHLKEVILQRFSIFRFVFWETCTIEATKQPVILKAYF